MAFQEKRAWLMALVSVAAYVGYLAAVLGRAGGTALADAPYVAALLWSVGAAIVANIVLQIPLAATAPHDAKTRDRRDREIDRFGDHVGQWSLVLGGVVALVLAMTQAGHFWIANAVYLAFVLSAVLGSVGRIAAHRRGSPTW